MPSPSVFSNHAGTLSDSYAIGKRGIKLLQGTSDPAGVDAPMGSLYILRGLTTNKVYQIDADGVWTALLSPDDIISANDNLTVAFVDGKVTITAPTTKHRTQFTTSDLSAGVLTVTHNLSEDYPIVQIYDNTRKAVLQDVITTVDANSLTLGLSSYGSFSGTWTVTIIAS
jgi:hypothetical protein